MENGPDRDAVELAALRKRFPKPTNAAAAIQCATILLVNGYLAYLVATGLASPVSIAVFSLGELLVLSVISHLALIVVPKASRLGDSQSGILQKVVVMALGLAWLGGTYFISVSVDTTHIEQIRRAPSLLAAFQSLNIATPLLFAALATAFATFNDLARWRGAGGLFVPQYALSGAPKILTLIIAPIPAVLISAGYAKADLATGLIVWCAVYIGIKTLFEFLILAFQYFGMPEAKPKHARA